MNRERMLSITTLVTVAGLIAAGFANAAERNPLHPQYYVGKLNAPAVAQGTAVDADVTRNPLHPKFARSGYKGNAATAQPAVKIQIARNNPLHPMFVR